MRLTSHERRARLGDLAAEADRRGWRDLWKFCIRLIARLVLAERGNPGENN